MLGYVTSSIYILYEQWLEMDYDGRGWAGGTKMGLLTRNDVHDWHRHRSRAERPQTGLRRLERVAHQAVTSLRLPVDGAKLRQGGRHHRQAADPCDEVALRGGDRLVARHLLLLLTLPKHLSTGQKHAAVSQSICSKK